MEKLDRLLEVLDQATGPLNLYLGCGIILILVVFTLCGVIIGLMVNYEVVSFAIAGGIIGFLIAVMVIWGIRTVFFKK